MGYIKIANVKDIGLGQVRMVHKDGKTLALINYDGDFFAVDNTCTHAECSLGEGNLEGRRLTCPCHGSQFDIETGEAVSLPAVVPVETYKTRVNGEDLEVDMT